jgi:hypothetical protein
MSGCGGLRGRQSREEHIFTGRSPARPDLVDGATAEQQAKTFARAEQDKLDP